MTSTETSGTPETSGPPDTATPRPGPADGGGDAPTRRRRAARLAAVVIGVPALVLLLGWLGLRLLRPHPYSGTVMQAPSAAPPMDGLVWSDGTPVDLSVFSGDLVLVYFGYTSCPDVCPTTLSQVANALDVMGDDRDRVHLMMVSIDPARDEPAMLGEYVRSFDPSFLGATGEPADVERVASTYGVYFALGEPAADGRYDVDHTSTLMGIDGDGHLRIVWPAVLDAERLAADLDELL